MADDTLSLKIQLAIAGSLQPLIEQQKQLAGSIDGIAEKQKKLPKEGGFSLASLSEVYFAIQNIQAIYAAVSEVVGALTEKLVGQNQQLQQLQFQAGAALANTLTVTEATTGRQIEGIEKIQALRAVAAAQQADLEKKSFDLVGVTSSQLQSVLSVTNQQVQQTGFSLNQNTDIATRFAAALGTYGVPLEQARQEVQSILSGQIDQNSILAQSIGITNEQVKAEKERGTLYDFLIKKTQAAVDANKLQSATIEGYTSNLQELFEQFFRLAGEPLTAELTDQLGELYDFVLAHREDLMELARQIGPALAVAAQFGGEALKRASNFIYNTVEALSSLAKGVNDATGVVDNAGRAITVALDTLQIAWNGLVLVVKLAGLGLQEFGAIVANGLNFEKTKSDIAALDDQFRDFAQGVNKENIRLGKELFEAAFDKDFVSKRLSAQYEAQKAAQEKRAADLKAAQENTNTQQAQTAEFQLKEFKRTEETKTATLDSELAKQQSLIQQSLANRQITQKEADDALAAAERQSLQGRLAILEEERKLTVAAVGDKGKDVAALDKQISETRLNIAKGINKQLLDDEKEARQQLLAVASGQVKADELSKQLNDGRLATAKAVAESANRELEIKIALARFQGNTIQAENLERDLLVQKTAQFIEQTRLQSESNRLQAEQNRLQTQYQILQNQAKIKEFERQGGHAAEIANLKEQNGILGQIVQQSYQLESASKKNALAAEQQGIVEKLRAAQSQADIQKILKLYDEKLRSEGKSESEIAQINEKLLQSLQLSGQLGSSADDTATGYKNAADQAGRLADNLGKAKEQADSLESKNASSGKYEGRAGGLTGAAERSAAVDAQWKNSDAYGDALTRYNQRVLLNGGDNGALLSYGDDVPARATGAIEMPVPGGKLRRVAEAGSPEAIIPLNQQGMAFLASAMGQYQGSGQSATQMDLSPLLEKFDRLEATTQRAILSAAPINITEAQDGVNTALEVARQQNLQALSAMRR